MSLLARYLGDAYQAWVATTASCCSRPSEEDEKAQLSRGMLRHSKFALHQNLTAAGPVRPMTTLYDSQPRLIPPPIPNSHTPPHSRTSSHEWLIRTKSLASRASTKTSFSLKRKLNMYNPYQVQPRRPQIGAPMDFRHVEVGREPKRRSFRPLELSIYREGNHLSPLPAWECEGRTMSLGALDRPPPPAHVRSESAMSMFTIPRKAVASGSMRSTSGRGRSSTAYTTLESMSSGFSPTAVQPLRQRPSLPESLSDQELIAALDCDKALPKPPQAARLRANTMPVLIEQVERVKSVMQERAELDAQLQSLNRLIDERQSLYIQSRPVSLYPSSITTSPPLPPLPLLQKPASSKESPRPRTAPSRPTVHIPHRSKSFSEASSAFSSSSSSSSSATSPPPPPPLPLFLSRQVALPPPAHPLRKKKSFSRARVSSWLFPGPSKDAPTAHAHTKSMSIDSITNTPRPVTAKEGFYQCVAPVTSSQSHQHRRGESESSVQTISTLDGPDGPTAATSYTSMGGEREKERCGREDLGRSATFGQRLGMRVSRVGVAF